MDRPPIYIGSHISFMCMRRIIFVEGTFRRDRPGGDNNQRERAPDLGKKATPLVRRIQEVGRQLLPNHGFLLRRCMPVSTKAGHTILGSLLHRFGQVSGRIPL
jgi:hypothetical protein